MGATSLILNHPKSFQVTKAVTTALQSRISSSVNLALCSVRLYCSDKRHAASASAVIVVGNAAAKEAAEVQETRHGSACIAAILTCSIP